MKKGVYILELLLSSFLFLGCDWFLTLSLPTNPTTVPSITETTTSGSGTEETTTSYSETTTTMDTRTTEPSTTETTTATSVTTFTTTISEDPNGFVFVLKEDNTYEVTGYVGPDTEIDIPSEYMGVPVTSIGRFAFQNNPQYTSFSIPSTVTSIGDRAFYNCDGIVDFVMPDTVLKMGDYLFAYSDGLTNVTLSHSLTAMRNSTFEGCYNLRTANIPEGATIIEAWAFQGCGNLTSITIPAGVTRIFYTAFGECTSLTSVVIPIGVTEIQYNAFRSCSSLRIYCEAAAQPEGWSSTWNPSARPVVWGYVSSPSTLAFESNGGSGVEAIIRQSGTEVTAPADPTKEGSAFAGWFSDPELTVPYTFTTMPESDLTVYAKWTLLWKETDYTFFLKTDETYEVTGYLGIDAEIHLPSSYLGIPVTSIGYRAFAQNPNLTKVIVPYGYVSMGEQAFYLCGNLETIMISSTVTAIIPGVFDECHHLKDLIVDAENPVYTSLDGVLFDKEVTTIRLYPNGKTATEYVIPETVATIGNGAFFRCTALTGIILPAATVTIEDNAFFGCTNLLSIEIPFGVTSIGLRAFCQCYSLTGLILPGSVTTIGFEAFKLCIELTDIFIPSSVTFIGHGPFRDAVKLTNILVDPDNLVYSSQDGVLYDESLTRLIAYPAGKTQTDFVIPASVTMIDGWAFLRCAALVNVTLPDGLASIDYEAFRDCPCLTTMIIPASVVTMSSYVFYGSSQVQLWVEAPSQPDGWDPLWNVENLPVIWGYSVWKSTIAFESNGGNAVDPITQDEGTEVFAPADPTRQYHAFAGWFLDPELTIPYVFTTMPEADVILYAKWEIVWEETDFVFVLKEDDTYEVTGYTGTDTVIVIPSAYMGIPVTGIGNFAFQNNPNYTSFTIPSTVTSIGNRAFYNCDGIVDFVMPDTVLEMGDYLFANCGGLTSVTLSQSLTTLRNSTFEGCSHLQSVTIPESVTVIEAWAFAECSSLTSINIPSGVTRILNTAFGWCSALTTIVVPMGVAEIQSYAFVGCTNLRIYCEASVQPGGWSSNWNPLIRPVVWGYIPES